VFLQYLVEHLDYDDENFKTVLVCLGQVAKLHPLVFATKDKEVIANFVMKELISVDRVSLFLTMLYLNGETLSSLNISLTVQQAQAEYKEGQPEWVADDKVSYEAQTKARIALIAYVPSIPLLTKIFLLEWCQ